MKNIGKGYLVIFWLWLYWESFFIGICGNLWSYQSILMILTGIEIQCWWYFQRICHKGCFLYWYSYCRHIYWDKLDNLSLERQNEYHKYASNQHKNINYNCTSQSIHQILRMNLGNCGKYPFPIFWTLAPILLYLWYSKFMELKP